jgi:Xaa-Pro aminopeptidase
LRPASGLLEAEWLPLMALEAMGWPPEAGPAGGPTPRPSLGSLLRGLRRKKDADELELLRRSMRAGEAGHRRARERVRPGISELEMYREIQSAALEALGSPALVYGDFRATHPSLPKAGGAPTGYRLREGDCFLCDFSVVVAGYRGDFTATLAVGAPSASLRELHSLCLTALSAGEQALKPGASGNEVYRSVAAAFAAAGRSEAFPHHAGHGIGLGHPEAPAFVPESGETLGPGEVVTLEPGIYVEGIGGVRIEHNYLVTPTGWERLTRHSLEL